MKKIIVYFLAVLSLVYIAGCTKFEEYQSVEVLVKPNISLSVSNVADSSFTMDFSTDKAGIIGFAVLGDTGIEVAAISILSNSLVDNAATLLLNTYSTDGPGGTSLDIYGLMPNSYYKVAVTASNIDGVESDVETFILKTNDGVGPTFVSSSPVISTIAAVPAGSDVVLTFDEPIKVDANKKFTFTYYFEGVVAETTLDSSAVSGNTVTVPLPREGHAGDYFFLSWEAGAVTDLSGNPCEERISGVVNGIVVGNYYRFEQVSFSVSDKVVLPENGSVLSSGNSSIDIEFPFTIYLSDELVANMAKFKYTSWDGLVTTEVSASANCEIVNDTILRITFPRDPASGDRISLYLDEGVILDDYDNPNSISEYEFSWTLPRLSIDDILGQYIVSGTSDFDGTEVTDTVSIELNPDEANSVIITGIFKNLIGASDPIVGYFDAANSLISIPEQVISGDDQYYYTAFSDLTADYSINVMILNDGLMNSDLALGVYDLDFTFLGYGEYLPDVSWTKMTEEKSAKLNHNPNSNVNKKITIRKVAKGMK